MSDKAAAQLVKRCAAEAGYDATIFKMQEVSRHLTAQVLSDYFRFADRSRDHARERYL